MSQPLKLTRQRLDIVVYEGFKSFEAIGPMTVFSCANRILTGRGGSPLYEVNIVAAKADYIGSDTPMGLYATTALSETLMPDTCLIVGAADSIERLAQHEAVVEWIRRNAHAIPRFATLCTGAFFWLRRGCLRARSRPRIGVTRS